jgi:hypothetical protein
MHIIHPDNSKGSVVAFYDFIDGKIGDDPVIYAFHYPEHGVVEVKTLADVERIAKKFNGKLILDA